MSLKNRNNNNDNAFSLIELSLVIVIIAMVIGAILTYKSLFEAAKLRSIITEISTIKRTVSDFKDKYFAFPGDMTLAFTYWGAACGGNIDTLNGGCNGDGDGQIVWDDIEGVKAWQHMMLAGMLSNDFDGICNLSNCEGVPDQNIPESQFPHGGYYLDGSELTNWRNSVGIARAGKLGDANANILTPDQALTIEIKLDDRLPGEGLVQAVPFEAPCIVASVGGLPETYNYTSEEVACQIYFKLSSF